MEKRVYGIAIGEGVNADTILEMNDTEKRELIKKYGVEGEVYTLEKFFYYLNSFGIDTENMYWVAV